MNNTQFLDAGIVQTLESADPEVKIRIDRILYKDRDISVLQSIRNLLHKERIGCGSCTDPYEVHTIFETLEHMLLAGNLSRDLQTILLLHLLHPLKTRHTDTLKRSRMSARLPYTRTEYIDSQFLQSFSSLHHLLFSLCTARTGNHTRSRLCEHSPFIKGNKFQFLCRHNLSYYSSYFICFLYKSSHLLIAAVSNRFTKGLEFIHICIQNMKYIIAVLKQDRCPHVRSALC